MKKFKNDGLRNWRIAPRRLWPRTHAEALDWIMELVVDMQLQDTGYGRRPLNEARYDEWRAHRGELMTCIEWSPLRPGMPKHHTLCIYVDAVILHLQHAEEVPRHTLDQLLVAFLRAEECRTDPRSY